MAFLIAVVAALLVYEPAIHGPFVFDDHTLPFRSAQKSGDSLQLWLSGVRPVLMLSYWFNYQTSGQSGTLTYHVCNLVIHALNSLLAGAIVWAILGWTSVSSQRRWLLAIAVAGVFLLHPLQSESVAYIAGRSESLSALWCLCAWTVSLYRRDDALSWRRAFAIVAFFALALTTKEHTVALSGVLLLTDLFASSESLRGVLRRNWRLYALLAAGAVLGAAGAWRVLTQSTSAGFQVAGVQWHEYALTQARVLWAYVRLVLLPIGLTVDHDVSLSRSLADTGVGVAILGWIAVGAGAIFWRRKYPIASYGVLTFLVLIAPTSSIVPIKDAMAERRMYLPLLGLLLVALEPAWRLKAANWKVGTACASIALLLGIGTFQRSKDWSDDTRLWESAIAATPTKIRPYGNLASVYLTDGQCDRAAKVFEAAERAGARSPDSTVTAVWALALDCSGRPADAIDKMESSVRLQADAHAYAALARMYINAGKLDEAEQALTKAETLDPRWELTYLYRAMLKIARSDYHGAGAELRRVLTLNPMNQRARHLLEETAERSRSML